MLITLVIDSTGLKVYGGRRVARRPAWGARAADLAETPSGGGCRHQHHCRRDADDHQSRRCLPSRATARADQRGDRHRHGRRCLRRRADLPDHRRPGCRRQGGDPATGHGSSEERRRDGAHPARPPHPELGRARAPGLAEANRLWSKGEGGNRDGAIQAHPWRPASCPHAARPTGRSRHRRSPS